MSKKVFVGIFAALVLALMLSGLTSAYYYNYYPSYSNGNNYDSFSYSSSRTSGSGSYLTTRATNYDRTTQSYWDGHAWVDRTTSVRETREIPSYAPRNYNQPYGYYGNYYGNNYNNYNGYNNYNNYNPWYQKYWETPNYPNSYYIDYRPNYYVYGY